jgi:hypothetical protein
MTKVRCTLVWRCTLVPETIYETKQIIYPLGLEVEKFTRERMIAFYIVGLSMKTLRNALFIDSAKEKSSLKRCFGTFLSFLI